MGILGSKPVRSRPVGSRPHDSSSPRRRRSSPSPSMDEESIMTKCPQAVQEGPLLDAILDEVPAKGKFKVYTTHYNGARPFRVMIDKRQKIAILTLAIFPPQWSDACFAKMKRYSEDKYTVDQAFKFEQAWWEA